LVTDAVQQNGRATTISGIVCRPMVRYSIGNERFVVESIAGHPARFAGFGVCFDLCIVISGNSSAGPTILQVSLRQTWLAKVREASVAHAL
jgi:hypothetical protein